MIGTATYAYDFDDIGNRKYATELGTNIVYQANDFNQYVCVSNAETELSVPTYDADGNQTLVKTKTGVWTVVYDGNNRPVQWSCGSTNILFGYDWLGRRVRKVFLKNGVVTSESRFLFDGDRLIAVYEINEGHTSVVSRIFWSPSQTATSCPIAMKDSKCQSYYYTTDITKNVCEIVSPYGMLVQSYDYSPFGMVSAFDSDFYNPITWSSEFLEKDINVYSYLKRDFDPENGRWLTKDSLVMDGYNLYSYVNNQPALKSDALGLAISEPDCSAELKSLLEGGKANSWSGMRIFKLLDSIVNDSNCSKPEIKCDCCGGGTSGKFDTASGAITICADNIPYVGSMYHTVVHELIHAYDKCKGTDFNKCEQVACSEVRATMLSGACQIGGEKRRYVRTMGRYYYEPEEDCIKRSAKASQIDAGCRQGLVDEIYENGVKRFDPFDDKGYME